MVSASALSPHEWGATFSDPPVSCSGSHLTPRGALFRIWRDTASVMEQPRLTDHYLILHRGGPKQVTRRSANASVTAHVAPNALSLAKAGSVYEWSTEGPIGFAHLYLTPDAVDHVVRHEFDREPQHVTLVDTVGQELPMLAALIQGLERCLEGPTWHGRLVVDTLIHHILVQLVADCSNVAVAAQPARHPISPRRLQRIRDFIEANLSRDLDLAELAAVAGSSRYHFSRAFRTATGLPPYRYLIGRRIEAAKALLHDADELPIATIAQRCGFTSRRQFEAMFLSICGTSPARYRRDR